MKMKAKSRPRIPEIITAFAVIMIMAVIGYALGSYGAEWVRESRFQTERKEKTEAVLARMEEFVRIGNRLPDHEFHDINGNSVRLREIIKSQTVIAYLRNPCGNCRNELFHLNRATAEAGDQSFFVLISDSESDMLMRLKREFDLTGVILRDTGSIYRKKLGIFTFPFNIIVDDSLIIKDLIAGYIRSDEFRAIMENKGAN